MALNKIDKEKQLRELTNIVTGIRLFNRNCGKGGEGIDDCKFYEKIYYLIFNKLIVPLILRDALQVTSQAADEAIANSLKLAFELTGNQSSFNKIKFNNIVLYRGVTSYN